jgi:Uma2 family endonuclease
MITRTEHLTLDEFVRLYEKEGPFELIDGQRIILSPQNFGHSSIANFLLRRFQFFDPDNKFGEAFVETPFVMPSQDNPNWVKGSRVPDVMFVRAERIQAYKTANPDWFDQPLKMLPDLVVEIVSPTDSYSEITTKVEKYLEDGVPLIWVIDRKQRTVAVRAANSNQTTTYYADQKLTGGDVIPGFEIAVADIFR